MKIRHYILPFLLILFVGCGSKAQVEDLTRQNETLREQYRKLETEAAATKAAQQRLTDLGAFMNGFHAKIVTTEGTIDIKFYPDLAPIHVFAFITRAESGFYNETYFHRVMPGFMIQGGDPNTRNNDKYDDGLGGPMGAIPHEFNPTEHKRGILSMARVNDKSLGAGSQFFIMHAEHASLNNEYTAFGEVVSGMDVVDKIATGTITTNDPRLQNHPANPVRIRSIEIYKPTN